MIELGLLEAYHVASIRANASLNKGELDEQATAQMMAVSRIRKAAREILDEMGVPDIEPVLRIGDVLRDIREKLGMRKYQLANAIGVEASTFGRYEKKSFIPEDRYNNLIEVIGERISDEERQLLSAAFRDQKILHK